MENKHILNPHEGFRVPPMLYHIATETLWRVRLLLSLYHETRALHSARISKVKTFCLNVHLWEKCNLTLRATK